METFYLVYIFSPYFLPDYEPKPEHCFKFCADSSKYLGHLLQVGLAHQKNLIVSFKNVVWFIGFWTTIL